MLEEAPRAIDGATEAFTSAFGADLSGIVHDAQNAATVAAAGGDLNVDLYALYDYFNAVSKLYEQVSKSATANAAAELPQNAFLRVESALSSLLGEGGIPGVNQSVTQTQSALSGSGQSLQQGLMTIQAALGRHLEAVAATYHAYLQADQTYSDYLSAASGGAGKVTYGSGPSVSATPQESKPIGF